MSMGNSKNHNGKMENGKLDCIEFNHGVIVFELSILP
jgi:hypothetical protein